MSFETSIEALRHDSVIWDDIAEVTGTAAAGTAGLTLDESQMSWASRPTGLLTTYEDIRAKAAMLLGEATTNFHAMRDTLNRVADDYTASDEDATRRLAGTWDPQR